MIRPARRIRRRHRGGYDLSLPANERELLRHLPVQLLTSLDGWLVDGEHLPEHLHRLVPPAYLRDIAAEENYRQTVGRELLEHHQSALTLLSSTADATRLDDEQAESWLSALNALRLALGSMLAITEDSQPLQAEDLAYEDWICYQYLSFLQSEVIDAMSSALPAERSDSEAELPEDPWGDPPGGLRWDGTARPERPDGSHSRDQAK